MENGKLLIRGGMIGYGVKFERIRRITGYLVGTLDRFYNAQRADEHDRGKHFSVNKNDTNDILSN